jgi:hypothetical protein
MGTMFAPVVITKIFETFVRKSKPVVRLGLKATDPVNYLRAGFSKEALWIFKA